MHYTGYNLSIKKINSEKKEEMPAFLKHEIPLRKCYLKHVCSSLKILYLLVSGAYACYSNT